MHMNKLAIAAFCLLISSDCLLGQSGSDPQSGAQIDTNQIRPPVFPSPEEAAEIKTIRVVRRFPEVGFQLSGSFGWLKLDKLNASYLNAEDQFGVWKPSSFSGEQFSPELGLRISFSRRVTTLFQWFYGGEPGDGSFRYSLVSSSLLYSPICSDELFVFVGAGVGRYQLRAKREYNQTIAGNAVLKEITLDDCSETVTPLLALLEFRPKLSPQYSLFFMIRWIPNKTKSFVAPLWGLPNNSVNFETEMGGTWLTLGFCYGI